VHSEADSNLLTGTLPTQLGLWTGLTNLDYDSNDLEGTIPSQLINLPLQIMYENARTLQSIF
jgi:hypothetical protein